MKWLLALAFVVACSKAKDSQPQTKAPPEPTPDEVAATAPTAAKAIPAQSPAEPVTMWTAGIKTLQGAPTSLGAFKGKALLLVNVASECGNTPQYAGLEALQKKYEAKGFTVIGFPCNQFGGQEPGSPQEIAEFCKANYGVTFPLMEKIEVNGRSRHPIYGELTRVADIEGTTGDIRWNFEKFVVSADGKTITRFSPKTPPDDERVIAAIENALPR